MSFRTAVHALTAEGGMARTHTLLAMGVTARELSRAREAGEIVRPRQGLYALPATSPQEFHAASHGGIPAAGTAARLHGLWVLDDDTIHVWMGAEGRRLSACENCCLHWSAGRPEAGNLPSIPQTLLQMLRCGGEESFFAALESALRQRLLSDHDRSRLRSELPRHLRWLLDFAREDADSGLESIVRLRLHRLGIDVRTQIVIHGTGRVDLLIGDRLLIEIDGKQNHDGRAERHKDLIRDAFSAIWGYETLRFDFAMVIYEWDLVEHAIVAKIAAGAHLWPRS
ncbi:very-short-patch-repair endonuclease [Microbacterium natoriense]|uniref:Very-short-patch-repair endonuclease n=1 Tax=Microbacterium natoriense TaxID=284570 RepID=A0AAW8F0W1_9MICO|nr:type IV toxin-antitoxin system AbiEi family antitoxin domain-containing protein [Microbacterium natoriense]MDQ0649177.1 very-short-patch-repair endonuclease [Microbacterium natoriense]